MTRSFAADLDMELTFVTDLGGTSTVEIDPNMELENVMALLEAEVRCAGVAVRATRGGVR